MSANCVVCLVVSKAISQGVGRTLTGPPNRRHGLSTGKIIYLARQGTIGLRINNSLGSGQNLGCRVDDSNLCKLRRIAY
jgi:hypothetical protein